MHIFELVTFWLAFMLILICIFLIESNPLSGSVSRTHDKVRVQVAIKCDFLMSYISYTRSVTWLNGSMILKGALLTLFVFLCLRMWTSSITQAVFKSNVFKFGL